MVLPAGYRSGFAEDKRLFLTLAISGLKEPQWFVLTNKKTWQNRRF
jgi:hypothetical protein